MKSFAIFLKQWQSHSPEIIFPVIAFGHIYRDIQHLEIHQFLPTSIGYVHNTKYYQ